MTDAGAAIIILSLVTAQRLAELVYARRNEQRLRSRGAVEHAAGHYHLIVALHGAWLAGLWLTAVGLPIDTAWLVVFVALQLLRLWVLATLKDRWTTRIIVLPDTALVASGPYRVLRHPNYAVVAAEILVLPMVFGLIAYGAIFALVNTCILAIRIRAEDQALHGPATPRTEPSRHA